MSVFLQTPAAFVKNNTQKAYMLNTSNEPKTYLDLLRDPET